MRRIIRRRVSGQVLGALLLVLGLGVLLAVFLKAYSAVNSSASSSNILSSMWTYILDEQVDFLSMATLKLTYVSIMGAIFLFLGVIVFGFSKQVFYLSGESVWLQCPYCRNSWKARRAVGWAECPHCRKFIQPEVKKTLA